MEGDNDSFDTAAWLVVGKIAIIKRMINESETWLPVGKKGKFNAVGFSFLRIFCGGKVCLGKQSLSEERWKNKSKQEAR